MSFFLPEESAEINSATSIVIESNTVIANL